MVKNKPTKTTEISTSKLRALIWWAYIGVERSSNCGSYSRNIIPIIKSYSSYLGRIIIPEWGRRL